MRLLILFIASLLIALPAQAGDIYKYTDEEGVTHYTTTPPSADAKPAELPELSKGDVGWAKTTLQTCNNHGGIDCSAGEDEDGSVICYDGFKKAAARFKFHCNTPKLEIAEISEIRPDGSFSVFIRNSKSVDAEGVKAVFILGTEELPMIGPREIESFGLAEFGFEPRPEDVLLENPKSQSVRVSCTNCDG